MTNDEMIARAVGLLRPHRTVDGRVHGDVAAVVVGDDGAVFDGLCIDTASWGLCAKRSALAAMVTAGQYGFSKVVAVWRNAETEAVHVLPPCGICREFMRQISPDNLDAEIVLGPARTVSLRQLLPEHEWPAPLA